MPRNIAKVSGIISFVKVSQRSPDVDIVPSSLKFLACSMISLLGSRVEGAVRGLPSHNELIMENTRHTPLHTVEPLLLYDLTKIFLFRSRLRFSTLPSLSCLFGYDLLKPTKFSCLAAA